MHAGLELQGQKPLHNVEPGEDVGEHTVRTRPGHAGKTPSYLVGALWAGLNAGASVLLPFALFVFFAREISPPLLGLVALAMACTEMGKAIGLPGVYEALLQQRQDVWRCHQAAMALLICASGVLAPACLLVIYSLGFLMPDLHRHFMLLSVLALRIPLDLLVVQPQAVLVERLAFRRLALRTIVANVLAGTAGVLIALLVEPVDGLVAYQLVQSMLTFAATSIGGGLMARPHLHRDCIRRLRSEMLLSTGNRSLAATINYLDQMTIAPLAGEVGLAYYNLGKRLENTFVTVASSFSAILFQPLFAADGILSKRKATFRALFVLTLVCGIPASVVFCNGRLVVGLLFGRNWLGAAPVVAWLSLNGFVRAVGMVPGSFLSVSGRNRELLMTSIASAAGSLALVVALAPVSIRLCAIGLVIKNAGIVAWMAWLVRREVSQPAATYLITVIIPLAVMIVAVSLCRTMLAVDVLLPTPTFVVLTVSGLCALIGGGVWIGLANMMSYHLTHRRMAAEIRA